MELFFTWDVAGRLVVAALLGAIVGSERELDDHPAGMRTFMTVCVGAALFGVVSTVGFDEFAALRSTTNYNIDVTRVASQVVVGIGFLGAGLIFRRGDSVINLTTAASLWATAAVGLAAGVGNVGLAILTTVIVAAVLLIVPLPKRWLLRRFGRERRTLELVPAPDTTVEALRTHLETVEGLEIGSWNVEKHDGVRRVKCQLTCRVGDCIDDMVANLSTSDLVTDLRPTP